MVVEIYNDHLVLLSFVMHAQSMVSNCVLHQESRLFYIIFSMKYLYASSISLITAKIYLEIL